MWGFPDGIRSLLFPLWVGAYVLDRCHGRPLLVRRTSTRRVWTSCWLLRIRGVHLLVLGLLRLVCDDLQASFDSLCPTLRDHDLASARSYVRRQSSVGPTAATSLFWTKNPRRGAKTVSRVLPAQRDDAICCTQRRLFKLPESRKCAECIAN
ncbi:hypothetical protein EDB83DRAFT_1482126 [Lactarius deliciosus]|nr:hypothetical protein EDB83DRAFT_1482126 [Lactarius deliciosus]